MPSGMADGFTGAPEAPPSGASAGGPTIEEVD